MGLPGVVALTSGGLDSLALVDRLLHDGSTVVPVYIRFGLRWEAAEQSWLKRWLSCIRHPRLCALQAFALPVGDLYGVHWSLAGRGVPSAKSRDSAVYLPGRNVFLLGAAAVRASGQGIPRLALGTLAGNPFGDATPEFFSAYAAMVSRALGTRISISAPLRRLTKAQLIGRAPTLPFALTFSCLDPSGLRHCGRCNKCAERRRAFRQARVPDPTTYVH